MSKREYWQIEDWMGRVLFGGMTFNSFEDGWAHIRESNPMPDESDPEFNHWYDDYYVEPISADDIGTALIVLGGKLGLGSVDLDSGNIRDNNGNTVGEYRTASQD